MSGPISVIVPAHNEEAVISGCLERLTRGAQPGDIEVIVVPNGCSDSTAQVARKFGAGVQVVELSKGSKPAALNAGIARASGDVVFVVDADVLVDLHSLRAAAAPLRSDEASVAAPALRVDCSTTSRAVSAYYAVWTRLPYVTEGLVGSGVYGLSRTALRALGPFPNIIGDDALVRTSFPVERRRTVSSTPEGRDACFVVTPPASLRDLLRIEVRRRAADQEMRELLGASGTAPGRQLALAMRLWRAKQISTFSVIVFVFVKIACRVLYAFSRLRGTNKRWRRDESSRARPSQRGVT
ncbi:MAG: glycosyltransferase [Planctomycetota bacterium]|nr:glycosyltransferase [Planctomycetota bacterium]